MKKYFRSLAMMGAIKSKGKIFIEYYVYYKNWSDD